MKRNLNNLNQHHIDVLKSVITFLFFLTFGVQILIAFQFPEALTNSQHLVAFFPAYLTLLCTYGFLLGDNVGVAAHVFLLGMIAGQFLILVNLTGPITYVYVSYTNVVLVAGLVLGPYSGLLYMAIVVSALSVYFWLAKIGAVNVHLLDKIQYGKEMELLATLACVVFTGLTIFYSVLKMEQLYRAALDEKEKADKSYQAMTEAQLRNETRAKYGAAIGALSKRIVQFVKVRDYVQITAEEIGTILQAQMVLISLPENRRLCLKGWSVRRSENDVFGYNQTVNEVDKVVLNPAPEGAPRWLHEWMKEQGVQDSCLCHSSVVPLLDANDQSGFISVFSDTKLTLHSDEFLKTISDILTSALYRSKAEEQLRQSQKMETIGLLAGGIAHDFNNLLTAILGNAEVAKARHQSPSSVKTHLEQITRASNQAASLTHKLLTLTKKSIHLPTLIDVNHILLDMEAMLQPLFVGSRRLEVKPSSSPASVFLDQKDLENILLNLIINAKDSLSETGRVEIVVSLVQQPTKPTCVQIQVRDNGSGMSTDVQSKIFEPFFTTKHEGTGLGLTMVEAIVQEGNGRLEVHSVEGSGTSFTLQFPFVEQDQRSVREQSNVLTLVKSTRPRTILVVDDNDDVRQVVQTMLSDSGYEAISASGGQEALRILRKQRVDLVLSDSIMPEVNGLQLLEQIKREFQDIPFVMMTGFSADKDHLHGIPMLEKPISMNGLLDVLERLLTEDQTWMSG